MSFWGESTDDRPKSGSGGSNCRLAKRKATCCHGKPISLLHKRQYGLYVMFEAPHLVTWSSGRMLQRLSYGHLDILVAEARGSKLVNRRPAYNVR